MDKTELRKDIKIKSPTVHDSVFVADGARVIGDVILKKSSSIWYNTVARADINKIIIGERSNVQDNSVIHLENDQGVIVGNDVTIGHNAIIHGCIIEEGALRNFAFQKSQMLPFKEFIKENPEIWTPKLKKELYEACRTIIEHEDAFIDLAFEMGPMEGLTAQEVKDYIRFIGNRRLTQLGLEPIYDVQKNPLGWLDTMLNAVEHMNFFEGRATEYSKASTQGSWVEAFS